MDETQKTRWGNAKADLDAMTDEEVMSLVVAALDRLQPEQLTQAQNAIIEMRRAKEQEVREALVAEFRERAASVGIPLEALFRRAGAQDWTPGSPLPRSTGGLWERNGREEVAAPFG